MLRWWWLVGEGECWTKFYKNSHSLLNPSSLHHQVEGDKARMSRVQTNRRLWWSDSLLLIWSQFCYHLKQIFTQLYPTHNVPVNYLYQKKLSFPTQQRLLSIKSVLHAPVWGVYRRVEGLKRLKWASCSPLSAADLVYSTWLDAARANKQSPSCMLCL